MTKNTRMVKTCSAKCPVCQRVIADSDLGTLIARVKRHALLKHDMSISDIQVEDLSCVARVFGVGREEEELQSVEKSISSKDRL